MKLGAPGYLLLLWLIPALVILYAWGFRQRDRLLAYFAEGHLLASLLPGIDHRRRWTKALALVAGATAIVLSLAQPRWGYTWQTLTRRGVDVMIAVDVSQSMKATDVSPDRLERAKRELVDLLGMLHGDRIGLVAFAGVAFVQCPLTLDYGAFRMFIDYLDPGLIPVPGTAIGDAIRKSVAAFDPANPNARAIIVITDGEDHQGDLLAAAKEAAAAKVTIYTIGIGGVDGAPVPNASGGGFMKQGGEMVVSRLDEESLQKVALETGGGYVRSTTGDLDLETIYEQGIRRDITAQDLKSERQKRWEERFQWPLGLAFALLLFEALLPERRRAARDLKAVGGPR